MHLIRPTVIVAACILALSSAAAQNQQRGQAQPASPGPYKPVTVTPPQVVNDAALETLRKQLGEVSQQKDRAALAKLVVGQGFFWIGERGDRADKRRSGIDNLAAALGLKNKDGAGWDMLTSFADEPTGAPLPDRRNVICAPADNATNIPTFLRIVTPTGKTGFVSVDSLAPIGNDQLCYVKEAGDWKIGGYIGAGDVQ